MEFILCHGGSSWIGFGKAMLFRYHYNNRDWPLQFQNGNVLTFTDYLYLFTQNLNISISLSPGSIPAFIFVILNCSSTVATPSRSGSNSPLLAPFITIIPYFWGSSSDRFFTGSGAERTSTEYWSPSRSASSNGLNLGSSVAAATAFFTISS